MNKFLVANPESEWILVTGAVGMLGREVAHRLAKANLRVLTASRRAIATDHLHVRADLTDESAVAALFDSYPIGAVAHLAAIIPGAPESTAGFASNLRMTRNLLTHSARVGVRRFVLASSVAVYGTPTGPCEEEHPTAGKGPYAEGKLEEESLVRQLGRGPGFSACSLRIAAPYGGNATAPTVVDRFVSLALAGSPLRLFGTGRREQHFVHKRDVANAFERALTSEATGEFNVSGPHPVSMLELAQTCIDVAGSRSVIEFAGEDPQDSYRGKFPWAKASAAFGYQPSLSLSEGLRLMIGESQPT